jgi:hypothetical protein
MATNVVPSLVRKAGQGQILAGALEGADVTVHERYFYLVDFGPDVKPRHHIVGKDGFCTCSLESECPAVEAVKQYLKAGGQRSEDPRPGYFPVVPARCPICGAKCRYDPNHSSKRRGVGWECTEGRHYWAAMAKLTWPAVKEAQEKRKQVEIVTFDNNPFAFKDGYDPNREYPVRICPRCGQPI